MVFHQSQFFDDKKQEEFVEVGSNSAESTHHGSDSSDWNDLNDDENDKDENSNKATNQPACAPAPPQSEMGRLGC